LRKATALAKSLGLEQVAQYSVSNLVDVEEARGNFKQALNYMKELAQINDTILARNNRTHLNELEAKYHAEKNLLQISQLEAEKKIQDLSIRQKNFLNSMLLLGAVILLVIMLLLFRTYRQKQTLQQRRIRELEMEKTLATTEAILKGEEQERTRLAKDLHDGLGGMLSGIKYSFSNMKGNLIMTPENHQAFARSMDMLDSSIMEMRRVAHNMMPEALVKFGLDTALRDYCNDFNLSGAIKAQYQSLGMEHVAIEQTMAITIYRVVQELMTNTLKHAAARNALVQLAMVGNTLTITVEDDGKGFELESLSDTHGIGWTSIRNRIDFLKGRLDVRSQPGKGTSVFIEVDFSKKD
jgi:signal transduction histidine kinase